MRETPLDPRMLLEFVENPQAVKDLRAYFMSGTYPGGRFERLGGGGDRPEVADRFTADDLVAVSLLGASITGEAALEILEARTDELGRLLAQIPADQHLCDDDERVLPLVTSGGPAAELWSVFCELPGCGWATAGKLLARKRPILVPVDDPVLRVLLGRSEVDGWWLPLRAALLDDDARLLTAVSQLRERSGIGSDIGRLRTLYVVLWMEGKRR